MEDISFRRAALSDVTEIKRLFTETLLTINRKDYTAEETADWASCGERPGHWERLIGGLHFIVAVNAGDASRALPRYAATATCTRCSYTKTTNAKA